MSVRGKNMRRETRKGEKLERKRQIKVKRVK
jgi:hypothetical protein